MHNGPDKFTFPECGNYYIVLDLLCCVYAGVNQPCGRNATGKCYKNRPSDEEKLERVNDRVQWQRDKYK
jgi:hypothetical protein